MHQFWTKHITYFNFLLSKFLIVYKTRLKILSIFSEPWCFFSCEYFFQLIIPNQVVKCCLYCSICPFNKMNCELMLTYDTTALRQTGSRNLTGHKTLPTIWGTYMKLVTKYQISAINSCWEKWAYMFNVYKNQQSANRK
jgi:hypothetical protein